MKKLYKYPKIQVLKIHTPQLLAGSTLEKGGYTLDFTNITEGNSREYDYED